MYAYAKQNVLWPYIFRKHKNKLLAFFKDYSGTGPILILDPVEKIKKGEEIG